MAKAARGDDQYMVRFPEGLRDKIKAAAESHGRSMNTEIIERLEGYELIQWSMHQMREEREKLTAQLEATRDALTEQKALSASLQHMLGQQAQEAMAQDEAEYDAKQAIEKRFNELKAQSDYLDALKAELIRLSQERDAVKLEAETVVGEQAELIRKLRKSQDANAVILRGFRKVFLKAADGDDDELKKLVEAFQIIGEEDD